MHASSAGPSSRRCSSRRLRDRLDGSPPQAQAPVAPGGPILVADRATRSPLLRGDPARRRPQRVRRHDIASSPPSDARRLRGRRSSPRPTSAPRRSRCSTTGSSGGGNLIAMRPDRGARRAARPRHRQRRRSPTRYLRVAPPAGAASSARRCSSTAPPTAGRRRRDAGRHALLRRALADRQPGRDAARRRRRPGRRLHLRPRALGGLHPPGQPGLGRAGARRHTRRSAPTTSSSAPSRRHPARLGRPRQGRDPAGRRAAAPAREPDRGDEPDRMPLPRFWYLPARREGRGRHDRRRPPATAGPRAGSTGFEADSPPGCSVADWECVRVDVLRLPEHASVPGARGASSSDGFEIGLHLNTGCPNNFTPASLRDQLGRAAAGVAAAFPTPEPPR